MQLLPQIKPSGRVSLGRLRIKAVVSDGQQPLAQLTENGRYDSQKGVIGLAEGKTLGVPLPNTVRYYPDLQIDWSVSFDGGKSWQQAGTSRHKVYLVFAYHQEYYVSEKILYYSCTQGQGAAEETALVGRLWAPFASLSLERKLFGDSQAGSFTYYKQKEPPSTYWQDLCKSTDGDGECGAFNTLFEQILLLQGIKAQTVTLSPRNRGEKMLIKEWKFNGSGSSGNAAYPYVNRPSVINTYNMTSANRIGEGRYGWLGTPEVEERPGVAGQGNPNPYSEFDQHFILRVGNTYYDPSYGRKYESLRQWEEESVAGFYREDVFTMPDGKPSIKWVIRKNLNIVEINGN